MDLMLEREADGHLACTLIDQDATAMVVASDVEDAANQLESALADARDHGYGECVWPLTDGEYKWLFRRSGDRMDVVVMWSAGVVTGWQHVFRSEADAATLETRIAEEVARVRRGGIVTTDVTHAGGVVYRAEDDRILLVRARPAPHDWVLPKGHIEDGETPEKTAAREVTEEAGVLARVAQPLGVVEFTKENGIRARVLFFLMRFERDVAPAEERESRWWTFDEAAALIPFENTRAILEGARRLTAGRSRS